MVGAEHKAEDQPSAEPLGGHFCGGVRVCQALGGSVDQQIANCKAIWGDTGRYGEIWWEIWWEMW